MKGIVKRERVWQRGGGGGGPCSCPGGGRLSPNPPVMQSEKQKLEETRGLTKLRFSLRAGAPADVPSGGTTGAAGGPELTRVSGSQEFL